MITFLLDEIRRARQPLAIRRARPLAREAERLAHREFVARACRCASDFRARFSRALASPRAAGAARAPFSRHCAAALDGGRRRGAAAPRNLRVVAEHLGEVARRAADAAADVQDLGRLAVVLRAGPLVHFVDEPAGAAGRDCRPPWGRFRISGSDYLYFVSLKTLPLFHGMVTARRSSSL